jgi:hypothetical protein
MKTVLGVLGTALLATGCLVARDVSTYDADVVATVQRRANAIAACRERFPLEWQGSGTVRVEILVERKTGTFGQASVDPGSTAPEPIQHCVVRAVDGLRLEPPDRHIGVAVLEWTFRGAEAPVELTYGNLSPPPW